MSITANNNMLHQGKDTSEFTDIERTQHVAYQRDGRLFDEKSGTNVRGLSAECYVRLDSGT
ncbi:MAG: hypothetical protein JWO97_4823 [Acidobacteria bacterium]|nr:hypothetical protein [Acidobacteriota bacterium]